MATTLFGIPYFAWAALALAVALAYLRWRPPIDPRAPRWARVGARWLHPAVWAWLAAVAMIAALGAPDLAGRLAPVAGLGYVGFLIAAAVARTR